MQERQRWRQAFGRGVSSSARTTFICLGDVQVRLKEYGSELIEIADNGGGVDAANHQSLTLKYHTSKLQQFSDLQASLCSFHSDPPLLYCNKCNTHICFC